jgi:hypothetical protein
MPQTSHAPREDYGYLLLTIPVYFSVSELWSWFLTTDYLSCMLGCAYASSVAYCCETCVLASYTSSSRATDNISRMLGGLEATHCLLFMCCQMCFVLSMYCRSSSWTICSSKFLDYMWPSESALCGLYHTFCTKCCAQYCHVKHASSRFGHDYWLGCHTLSVHVHVCLCISVRV